MSQENVELVRGFYAAVLSGDRERSLRFLDTDVVVDTTRMVFNPSTYRGIEALRGWLADVSQTWEEIHTEPHELIDAGDQVVVVGKLVGTGKGSGVEVRRPTAQVFDVRNGHIVRWQLGFIERREALEAVGLRE
jgi:uncharacterized protein